MTKEKIEIGKERESLIPWKSRPEYAEGRLKLNFEHIFDNGERLTAKEDKNGIATIVLKGGGKVIFDFDNLLQNDTQFITPSFLQNYIEKAEQQGFSPDNKNWKYYDKDLVDIIPYKDEWVSSTTKGKYVLVGEWRSPQQLLMLLHEIEHTQQDLQELDTELKKTTASITATLEHESKTAPQENIITNIKKLKQLMIQHSKSERNAWADAVKKMREIQKTTKVNLRSIFPTVENLKSFINTALCEHRHGYELANYAYINQLKDIEGEEIVKTGREEFKEWKKFQKETLKYFDKPIRE